MISYKIPKLHPPQSSQEQSRWLAWSHLFLDASKTISTSRFASFFFDKNPQDFPSTKTPDPTSTHVSSPKSGAAFQHRQRWKRRYPSGKLSNLATPQGSPKAPARTLSLGSWEQNTSDFDNKFPAWKLTTETWGWCNFPETNIFANMDGWFRWHLPSGWPTFIYFQGWTASFREGNVLNPNSWRFSSKDFPFQCLMMFRFKSRQLSRTLSGKNVFSDLSTNKSFPTIFSGITLHSKIFPLQLTANAPESQVFLGYDPFLSGLSRPIFQGAKWLLVSGSASKLESWSDDEAKNSVASLGPIFVFFGSRVSKKISNLIHTEYGWW